MISNLVPSIELISSQQHRSLFHPPVNWPAPGQLTGSDSVLHFDLNGATWISQSHGVHPFDVGATARLYIDVGRSFLFGQDGKLVGGSE